MFEIVIQEVLLSIWGSYSTTWRLPLTNVKWHSDPRPATVTSKPIDHFPLFHDLDSELDLHRITCVWFPWIICNWWSMQAGNAYPSGDLVPSPVWGLGYAPILKTIFFSKLSCLLSTFLLAYSSELSRFCFQNVYLDLIESAVSSNG